MSEWDLIGGNPAPGDPDHILDLGDSFREVAKDAIAVKNRLSTTSRRGISSMWTGEGAEAFLAKLEELPEMSLKVFESFSTAGGAMRTFANELRHHQHRARLCLDRAQQAVAARADALRDQEAMLSRFAVQADIDGLNSLEKLMGRRDIEGDYRWRIQAAEGDLDDERREAERIADDCRADVERLKRSIQQAREEGVRNAVRFGVGSWTPLGEHVTYQDVGESFNEAYDEMQGVLIVTGLALTVLASGGATTPAVLALIMTGTSLANTGVKGARKATGAEIDESWLRLGIDFGLDAVSAGAGGAKIVKGRQLAKAARHNAAYKEAVHKVIQAPLITDPARKLHYTKYYLREAEVHSTLLGTVTTDLPKLSRINSQLDTLNHIFDVKSGIDLGNWVLDHPQPPLTLTTYQRPILLNALR